MGPMVGGWQIAPLDKHSPWLVRPLMQQRFLAWLGPMCNSPSFFLFPGLRMQPRCSRYSLPVPRLQSFIVSKRRRAGGQQKKIINTPTEYVAHTVTLEDLGGGDRRGGGSYTAMVEREK